MQTPSNRQFIITTLNTSREFVKNKLLYDKHLII